MSKRETKVQARYIDKGFGFPVVIKGVPMIKVRDRWTPQIDYSDFAKKVLAELVELDGRLTGNQVKFIRLQLEMTLQQFAERLGLTHPAIIKWEKTRNKPTGMNWSTEKDIRLFITSELKGTAKDLFALYSQLETVTPSRAGRIELNAELLAA